MTVIKSLRILEKISLCYCKPQLIFIRRSTLMIWRLIYTTFNICWRAAILSRGITGTAIQKKLRSKHFKLISEKKRKYLILLNFFSILYLMSITQYNSNVMIPQHTNQIIRLGKHETTRENKYSRRTELTCLYIACLS